MISVIIPVYNVRAYLTDCLESVVDQTLEDKEVIFINQMAVPPRHEILGLGRLKENGLYFLIQMMCGRIMIALLRYMNMSPH